MPDGTREQGAGQRLSAKLRRDLGKLEAYAAMIGMLVGAGIFRVAGEAYAASGPSVILGYLVLAPAVLATAIAYVVFVSTPLGREPGGEYAHVAHTFGARGPAFVCAWLKLISYTGAAAFLARVLADYLLEFGGLLLGPERVAWVAPPALAGVCIAFFWIVHVLGVRWFARVQVGLCAILGVAIVVLVVPGLFAIERANFTPFFTGGASGFASALPPLFFAYAGFEALAHSAGEVRDSTRTLPAVYVRGLLLTTLVFVSMSAVAFGVLPAGRMQASAAPMAESAAMYLPRGAAALVALGGIAAVATSLNATLIVPARLGLALADDGLLPRFLGHVDPRWGTPAIGITTAAALAGVLLASGQLALALNVAVFALVCLYGLHSATLLALPRANPQLYAQATTRIPRRLQVASAWLSVAAMGGIVAVQVRADLGVLATTRFGERFAQHSLTSLELIVGWSLVGLGLYALRKRT